MQVCDCKAEKMKRNYSEILNEQYLKALRECTVLHFNNAKKHLNPSTKM